jgi:hypothetical protein
MNLLVVSGAAVVVFSVLPAISRSRLLEAASPGVLAAADLLGLLAWAVLPAAFAACLVVGVSAVIGGAPRSPSGACWLGMTPRDWQVAGGALAVLVASPLVVHAKFVYRRLSELGGLPEGGGEEIATESGAMVTVLPTDLKLAFAAGFRSPRAMVSQGVLASLGAQERVAVLEHEAAHARLGHPRLVVLAAVIEGAYGRAWPVRALSAALRRELEAVADQQAVRFVRRDALLGALLAIAEAPTAIHGTAGLYDAEHLRYRVRRLTSGPSRHAAMTLAVGALVAGLASLLAWSLCVFGGGRPTLAGLLMCLGSVSVFGYWPILTERLSPRRWNTA